MGVKHVVFRAKRFARKLKNRFLGRKPQVLNLTPAETDRLRRELASALRRREYKTVTGVFHRRDRPRD